MNDVQPLDRQTAETYAAWFRALADGTRVQIVSLLARAGRPLTVREMVAAVPVGQSTVSEHLRQLVENLGGREVPPRAPKREPGASSLYQHVPFRQDISYLAIGERANTNGSKAFREALLAEFRALG